jgi:regulator of replication initiation timing
MPSAEALDAIATCIEEMAERNRDLVLEVNRLNERLESFEVK